MVGMLRWRAIAKVLFISLLISLLTLAGLPLDRATGRAFAAPFLSKAPAGKFAQRSEAKPPGKLAGKITETAPPQLIQDLQAEFEDNQPQVKIFGPKPNEVLNDSSVAVRFQVKDLTIFKNERLGLGPHLEVLLDNQPSRDVYDLSQPLVLENLSPGTHTLRAIAARPWHESFKNDGAYAQVTFHVFTKTDENNPDPSAPLLTYVHPQGTYGAEPILLDFFLTNAPLHLVAQEDAKDEIADWRIRVTVNGSDFVLDQWQPLYLKGFQPGTNWIKLEYIDEQGNPVNNLYSNTARLITLEPNGQDGLAKLVRGDVSLAEVRAIADATYIYTAPEPTEPETPSEVTSPSTELSPVPTAAESPAAMPPTVAPALEQPEPAALTKSRFKRPSLLRPRQKPQTIPPASEGVPALESGENSSPSPKTVEKAEAEKAEAEKAAAEKVAAEKAEAEKTAAEKVAAEKAEAKKVAAEKAAAEKAEAEKAAAEKVAAEKAEAEKAAAEKVAAEKLAAEKKAAAEKLVAEKKAAAEKLAAEKDAAEKAAAEKATAEKVAAEKVAAEKAMAEKLTAEKAAAQRAAADKLEAEQLAAKQAAAEKRAAAQAERVRLAAEKRAARKAALEQAIAEKKAAQKATLEKAAQKAAAKAAAAEKFATEKFAPEKTAEKAAEKAGAPTAESPPATAAPATRSPRAPAATNDWLTRLRQKARDVQSKTAELTEKAREKVDEKASQLQFPTLEDRQKRNLAPDLPPSSSDREDTFTKLPLNLSGGEQG